MWLFKAALLLLTSHVWLWYSYYHDPFWQNTRTITIYDPFLACQTISLSSFCFQKRLVAWHLVMREVRELREWGVQIPCPCGVGHHGRVAISSSHPTNFWILGMVIIFLDQVSVGKVFIPHHIFVMCMLNSRGELQWWVIGVKHNNI